jgi:hypothetical protein
LIQCFTGTIEFLDIGVGEFYLNTGEGSPHRLFIHPSDFDQFKHLSEQKTLTSVEVEVLQEDTIPPGLKALSLAYSDR